MTTPPHDPQDERPQDAPRRPGETTPESYPPYPAQPVQPQQYPAGGYQQYPPGGYQQYPPGQPGGYAPQPYDPTQQGYNPYGAGGYGYGFASPGQLAGWPIRVAASILDSLLGIIPFVIGVVISIAVSPDLNSEEMTDPEGYSLFGGILVAFGLQVWNRIFLQGRTGQSLGKKLTRVKVVDHNTGQLIGFGRNLGREVCAFIFNQFCILNVLWPLWDDKHQTWHDKVVSDVVVKV